MKTHKFKPSNKNDTCYICGASKKSIVHCEVSHKQVVQDVFQALTQK